METTVEIDTEKYKIKSSEDKDSLRVVLDLIKNREVVNWAQLEMKGILNGIEINEVVFINLLKYIRIRYIYDFLFRSISECDDCIKYLECYETIERILNLEGSMIYEQFDGLSYKNPLKFSCVEFLSEMELRHPGIFLKYYLKTNPNIQIGGLKNGYINLLYLVIKRTKIRATKIEKYNEFIPKLEKLYSDSCKNTMFLN